MKSGKLNILLVDDDEVDRMNVERTFRKNEIRHNLFFAKDGVEAFEFLREPKKHQIPRPHIILLDVNMPRMGGLEFLNELRADSELSSIVVFMLTTSAEASDKLEAYRHNVAGYIVKPVSAGKFGEALEKLSGLWDLFEFL